MEWLTGSTGLASGRARPLSGLLRRWVNT